jgi:maltooligosyltrehalose trehalohydrolase
MRTSVPSTPVISTPVQEQPRAGAHLVEGGVRFRVPSAAEDVSVVLLGPDGERRVRRLPMVRPGLHEAVIPGLEAGARYLLRIGDREVPDPFARSLPEGPHGPAEVLAPLTPPADAARRPIDLRRRPVIYELHVGTFTPEGTFLAAIDKLDVLVELGITAVELLPVAAFPGVRNWGYDGVLPYAPDSSYGTPDELRQLVDAAH